MGVTEAIIAAAVALLGGSGLGAVLTTLRQRKREPIERDGLSLAQAQASAQMANDMRDEVNEQRKEDRARFEGEMKGLREELRGALDLIEATRKELATERELRQDLQDSQWRLAERVRGLEGTLGHAEDYIKRSWDNVRRDYPHAWPAFLPVPAFLTDPGFPAIPRDEPIPNPADDGQPADMSDTAPEGTP